MASDKENKIYFYDPSLAAAILFTIIYIIPLAYQIWTTIILPWKGRYPRANYLIPIVIGAALEVAGYGIRCASVREPQSIPLYAVSITVIVIAPVFVCASLYMLLGRLRSNAPDGGTRTPASFLGRFPVKWLPWIFVTLDVISVLTQGSGSGIASSGNWEGSSHDTGIAVLIAGLVLQVITFACFLVIVSWFHLRATRGGSLGHGVKMVLKGIYIAGFFVMVRSIYRVFEFALGIDSYTFTHEWPLYVLEAIPMLIALMALGWFHPGKWLAADHLGEGGKVRMRQSEALV